MFERRTLLIPAYEIVSGGKVGSIHPMHIGLGLVGPKGAAVLDINTGWYLQRTQKRQPVMRAGLVPHYAHYSVHTHLHVDGWHALETPCDWCNGAYCHSIDWTVGPADMEEFLERGAEYIWPKLEGLYEEHLAKLPEPQMYEGA